MHPVAQRASLVFLLGFSVIAVVSLVSYRKTVHGWDAGGLQVSAGGEHQPSPIHPNSSKSAIGGPAEFASAAEREIFSARRNDHTRISGWLYGVRR